MAYIRYVNEDWEDETVDEINTLERNLVYLSNELKDQIDVKWKAIKARARVFEYIVVAVVSGVDGDNRLEILAGNTINDSRLNGLTPYEIQSGYTTHGRNVFTVDIEDSGTEDETTVITHGQSNVFALGDIITVKAYKRP